MSDRIDAGDRAAAEVALELALVLRG